MEVTNGLSDKARNDLLFVEKAKNGDGKAFAALMNHYRDSIYFMLLKMVNNASDAEDLTIEAFGKAFRNLDSFTPDYAFSTWLFKIATNNCIDFIRKKKANHVSLDHTDEEHEKATKDIQAPVLDPEESLINDQKIKLMRSLVSKLKPRYRKLIELRYFSELSYEEIAEELELPIGTVKAQLFRARELLYNILKNTSGKM